MFEMVHAAKGIDVISMNAPDAEHGLSMSDPVTGRVVIVVATTSHPMRQRSSIAHELGHVIAGDLDRAEPLIPGERSPEEICADAFARHLLLPLDAVRRRVRSGSGLSLPDVSDLVQEFEVSPQIAAIQLRTLHLIDADTSANWCARPTATLAVTFGWGSQYRSLAAASSVPRAPQVTDGPGCRGLSTGRARHSRARLLVRAGTRRARGEARNPAARGRRLG
jgi:Zn-dependent peptidase ImmA (M78 family)